MNDNSSSGLLELQGLQLIRAFLRIRDEAERKKVLEFAERLAVRAQGEPLSTPWSELASSLTPTELPT
ncbi:hypothetical protein NLM27_26880 [Bradyrhizobium sp. CCGB12]|uniref:hypothetical protein n=1 Tax=Bradyrhizobium sp. CCGB12 TaxID=2949632 RepID=UPI0020B1BC7B|nr:hypothetical protein [Bradyrhizobium sp. CCGB12]MCP3392375.1 hypothetical protein [Bradyrhizobium sp. CCGB12]